MDIKPRAQDLWDGIGGHFDSFAQIICEFVDNSISNLMANKCTNCSINIDIRELKKDKIKVMVEDTGMGVQDFQPVLRLGDRSVRETPLNEHGFGLKHALASANHDNNSWRICTRTKREHSQSKYREVKAPYEYNILVEKISLGKKGWLGKFNGSGTIIEFECSKTLFETLRKGIRGAAGFSKCLDYLKEELGYVYAGIIESGKAVITIESEDYHENVAVVKPDWAGYYDPKTGSDEIDLGEGKVKIEYEFGEMKESAYVKHYKRNMETSGVELRINGRLLIANLFKEIWQIENHPSFNHFLVRINLISGDRAKLPKTRTSKNGIRSGDERLDKLFEWIRSTHPNPIKKLSGAVSERELVEELKKLKEKQIRAKTRRVQTDFEVFKKEGCPVQVDLYVFDGHEIVLYEAKKDMADVQSAYQLLMYWDGAVADGIKPVEGILLASSFSQGVLNILRVLNSRKDQNGNRYSLISKTWQQEGIPYPKP